MAGTSNDFSELIQTGTTAIIYLQLQVTFYVVNGNGPLVGRRRPSTPLTLARFMTITDFCSISEGSVILESGGSSWF